MLLSLGTGQGGGALCLGELGLTCCSRGRLKISYDNNIEIRVYAVLLSAKPRRVMLAINPSAAQRSMVTTAGIARVTINVDFDSWLLTDIAVELGFDVRTYRDSNGSIVQTYRSGMIASVKQSSKSWRGTKRISVN